MSTMTTLANTSSTRHGDADTSTIASGTRKARAGPSRTPQSPLPWFKRPGAVTRNEEMVWKGGVQCLPYRASEVPHPLSYGQVFYEQEVLGESIRQMWMGGNFSYLDSVPQRSLDVGCGQGTWILNAAENWRDTEFVGFDIARVQADLTELSPDAASRITWIHGNVLKPWPFDNNTFDHVRIHTIAIGVPESSLEFIVKECARVLTLGGRLEWYEEDIHFPDAVPPQYFNQSNPPPEPTSDQPSRPTTPSSFSPSDSDSSSLSSSSSNSRASDGSWRFDPLAKNINAPLEYDPAAGYDDNVIKALFLLMFKSRGISTNATSLLPFLIGNYFDGAKINDVVRIPMPGSDSVPIIDPFAPDKPPDPRPRRYILGGCKRGSSGATLEVDPESFRPHHFHAVAHVLLVREAVWDWIVRQLGWGEGRGDKLTGKLFSLRHPLVVEARADLDHAFKVFESRLELDGDFYSQIPNVRFAAEELAAAFDDEGTSTPHDPDTHPGTPTTPGYSSAHPHPHAVVGGMEWLLMDEASNRSSPRSSFESNGRQSRTSKDSTWSAYPTPAASSASLRKSSIPGPTSASNGTQIGTSNRPRTSSAPPEIRPGNRDENGPKDIFRRNSQLPCNNPLPQSRRRPINPESENIINLCGPDAEYTVPYASRVFRFFFAVKTENDYVAQPPS